MHLAQVNIARMRAPLTESVMAGFVARIEALNALADGSPGFVWRLQGSEGDATYLRPYDDDRLLFNLSVWETLERLKQYVYGSVHVEVMKQRHSWFDTMTVAYLALWWVPIGHVPSVEEAKERLEALRITGPTPFSFTFKQSFPAKEI
jgi:heme-degrading monooxygenase HmoA